MSLKTNLWTSCLSWKTNWKKVEVYSVVWTYLIVWIAFAQPSHEWYKCNYSFEFCFGLLPFPEENRINIQTLTFVPQATSISQFRAFCILIWREWNVNITSGEAGGSWDVCAPGKGGESVCLLFAPQIWLPSSAFHTAAALAPCHVSERTFGDGNRRREKAERVAWLVGRRGKRIRLRYMS